MEQATAKNAALPDAAIRPDGSDAEASFTGFAPLAANFTPTPNQFFDWILDEEDCVVKVVGHLIRATLGWEDPRTGARRVEASLPLSEFVRRGMARNSARKGLGLAAARGYIVRTLAPGDRAPARYALRWGDPEGQREALRRERLGSGEPDPKAPAQPPRAEQAPVPTGSKNDTPARGSKNDPVKICTRRGSKFDLPKKRKKRKENSPLNVGGESAVNAADTIRLAAGSKLGPPPGDSAEAPAGRTALSAADGAGPRPRRPAAGAGRECTAATAALSRREPGADTGARGLGPSAREGWLDRQAEALVEELRDRGSERRHRQLLSVCEAHGLMDLAREALGATRRRLAQERTRGPLERPGAYYARVLLRLLEERQVFVPLAGEDDADEVRRLARDSLGLPHEN